MITEAARQPLSKLIIALIILGPYAAPITAEPAAPAPSATSHIYTALRLGHSSLDLAFLWSDPDRAERRSILIEEIDEYMSKLGLRNLRYPDNPTKSSTDPTPLASYGQMAIDRLDPVNRAAFIVGWYGRLAEATETASSVVICRFAKEAEFEPDNCDDNLSDYLSTLFQKAGIPSDSDQ